MKRSPAIADARRGRTPPQWGSKSSAKDSLLCAFENKAKVGDEHYNLAAGAWPHRRVNSFRRWDVDIQVSQTELPILQVSAITPISGAHRQIS